MAEAEAFFYSDEGVRFWTKLAVTFLSTGNKPFWIEVSWMLDLWLQQSFYPSKA